MSRDTVININDAIQVKRDGNVKDTSYVLYIGEHDYSINLVYWSSLFWIKMTDKYYMEEKRMNNTDRSFYTTYVEVRV